MWSCLKKRASGALVVPLTGESLEPPTDGSYSNTVKFRAQA
jgi:hypothetical protein